MSTTMERIDKAVKQNKDIEFARPALAAQTRDRVNVLLLGGQQPVLRSLHATLKMRAKVTLAEDLPAALETLAHQEFQVVFCAACFHCGSWVEALETVGFLHPDIPVVVVNEAAQSQSIFERQSAIYAAGAFDVLDDPADELNVMVVLAHALASGDGRQWQAAC